jgi:hypothetical protein
MNVVRLCSPMHRPPLPYRIYSLVDCVWNMMTHAQKPDFVFRRKGRVLLNRLGRQFSRLLAAEVCASAVVMLDTPCSEVVWRVLATHSIRQFPLHFPSHALPCAITFQLDSTIRTVKDICLWRSKSVVRHLWLSQRAAGDYGLLEITVFWDVTPCGWASTAGRFEVSWCLHIGFVDCEDGGRPSTRNVWNYTPDERACAFLRSWQFLSWSRISLHFVEPQGSLPCSQHPDSCSYLSQFNLKDVRAFAYTETPLQIH